MDTTVHTHTFGSLQNSIIRFDLLEGQPQVFRGNEAYDQPPVDANVEITKLDFDQITSMLCELEREYGFSTLEMFRRYICGEWEDREEFERWFSLFFLYLGTPEVRHFSCP